MKKLFTVLLLAVSLSANAQLTNGLVAHWNFNGNANDISGNNIHGTANNVSYVAGKGGTPNSAADFNGTSSIITAAYNSKLNASSMSMCAIVKFDDFYKGVCQMNVLLARGTFFAQGSYSLSIFDNPYDGDCNIFDSTKLVFHQKTSDIENFIAGDSMKHSPNVKKNEWYCVVTTYDGSRTRIYVNGTQMATYSSNRSKGTSTEGLSIGGNSIYQPATFPYWLNGQIDDLRIYDRELSPAEVKSYCGSFDTLVSLNDTSTRTICIDDTFHLAYKVSVPFATGNVFTAQLSDISGSFNTPVNLGTLASTTNGTIVCTVPKGLLTGTGSRVRIVSSAPVKTTQFTMPVVIANKLPYIVTISANPPGPIQQNQTVTYVATIGNGGSTHTIKWYRNGIWIPNVTSDSLTINTLNDGDSIYAEVVSDAPCAPNTIAVSNVIYVQIVSSVNNIRLANLAIYPNPGSDNFNITANDINEDKLLLQVYNATGQVVHTQEVAVSNNTINKHIDIGQPANGVYLVRISANGKARNVRLIINR